MPSLLSLRLILVLPHRRVHPNHHAFDVPSAMFGFRRAAFGLQIHLRHVSQLQGSFSSSFLSRSAFGSVASLVFEQRCARHGDEPSHRAGLLGVARYALRFPRFGSGRAGSHASTRLLLFCRVARGSQAQYLLESGLLCGVFDGKRPSIAAMTSVKAAIDALKRAEASSMSSSSSASGSSSSASGSSSSSSNSASGSGSEEGAAEWSRLPTSLRFGDAELCPGISELLSCPSQLVERGFEVLVDGRVECRPAFTSTPTGIARPSRLCCYSHNEHHSTVRNDHSIVCFKSYSIASFSPFLPKVSLSFAILTISSVTLLFFPSLLSNSIPIPIPIPTLFLISPNPNSFFDFTNTPN